MIASHIPKDPNVQDSFRQLALYLAAASDEGEKLRDLWIVNCDAGETAADLETAIIEVEAVRAMKPGIANRSYHLIVSFRPGEEEKLSLDDLRDIERNFAEALGFAEHQRVVATHQNTDNFHMHVAYNRIHPGNYRVVTPFNDYRALERTARAMEKKYGLHVDLGMSDYKGKDRLKPSGKARDFEAHTWQQSFQNHLLENREAIVGAITEAKDWQTVHKALDEYGVELKRRANGLAFVQASGSQAMKASLLDRTLSKPSLEKRLGFFEPPLDREKELAAIAGPERHVPKRYEPRPITTHPKTSALWQRFLLEKPKQPSFLRRHFRNWKTFLMAEAYRDPLALVIIIAHREMLDLVFGPDLPSGGRSALPPVPAMIRPALDYWCKNGTWARRHMSPHLLENGIAGFGCKVDDKGNLMIPFRDMDGHIQALRLLSPEGKILDIGDTSIPGLVHVMDPKKMLGHGPAVIATDHTMAAMIQAATDRPVILIPDEHLTGKALKLLRRQYPKLRPVVALRGEAIERPVVDLAEAPRSLTRAKAEEMGGAVEDALGLEDALGSIEGIDPGNFTLDPYRPQTIESEEAFLVGGAVEDALGFDEALESLSAVDPETLNLKPSPPTIVHGTAALTVHANATRAEIRSLFAEALDDKAMLEWERAKEWASFRNAPWLKKAGVSGYGIRKAKDGRLLVPLRDEWGRLRDLSVISPDGSEKRMIDAEDGPVLFHRIDTQRRMDSADRIVVATDYASAAAIHRETLLPVVMIADADRWTEVVETLKKRHDADVVVALPKGSDELNRERGEKAASLGCKIVIPQSAETFGKYAAFDRSGNVGRLLDHGSAPYDFKKGNSESYYVKILDRQGDERVLWGKGLAEAVEMSGAEIGDNARFKVSGKEEVVIKEEVKDAQGNVTTVSKKATRIIWDGERLPETFADTNTLHNELAEAIGGEGFLRRDNAKSVRAQSLDQKRRNHEVEDFKSRNIIMD